MMKYVALMTGDYPELGLAELNSLFDLNHASIIEREGRVIVFESRDITDIINRATFIRYIAQMDFEREPSKSFRILGVNLSNSESKLRDIARILGNKVDLTNPEITYLLIQKDSGIYIGVLLYERDLGNIIKEFKMRPFNHPSSINPILARSMINISGVRTGGRIIDPFVGTGTFLLEASRMNIGGIGIDLSLKMIEGAKKNIKFYNTKNIEVNVGDFKSLVDYDFDSIVSDPPYGRGSKLYSENKYKLYQDLFSIINKYGYNYCLAIPGEEIYQMAIQYLDPKLAGKIFVHKSLTRYIITNNRSI